MVRTFLKVYMELGSFFLFLQEQIKDIMSICVSSCIARRVFVSSFSTGPPGDRGAFHCRWNVIAAVGGNQSDPFRFKRVVFCLAHVLRYPPPPREQLGSIRNLDPNAESRVELMSGGEVLGTALLMWLKNAEDDIEVAKESRESCVAKDGCKKVPDSFGVGRILRYQDGPCHQN